MTSIAGYSGALKRTPSELRAFVQSARRIGTDPDYLGAIFQFESGWDEKRRNAVGSGATGLIQFMPSTARNLGTTTDDLADMSFTEQLTYVEKYFAPFRGKIGSLEDLYLAVFFPAAIGTSNDHVIASEGSAVYEQNKGFDHEEKGFITKADVTSTIRNVYNHARSNPRIDVPGLPGPGTMIVGGLLAYIGFRLWKG